MIIIKDTREKVGSWEFSADICHGIIERKLDTGDYAIKGLEHVLCIERKKTVSEFAINSTDPTFKKCLDRMKDYEHKFIVFEFSPDDILKYPVGSGIPKSQWPKLKITNKYIFRFISEIQVKYGIHVVYGGDSYHAQWAAWNIMKRVNEQYN